MSLLDRCMGKGRFGWGKKTRTFFVYTNEAQTGLSQVSSYWVILHWDSCVNKDFYFVNLRNIFHLEKSEKVNKYLSFIPEKYSKSCVFCTLLILNS